MGGIQTEVRLKYSRDKWKSKARAKSLVIKDQKKRIAELEQSRAKWRERYSNLLSEQSLASIKVAHHSYDGKIIWLCVWLQLMGKLSFRGGRQVVVALGLYLGVEWKSPCASSIRLWVCKYGYFRYTQPKDEGSKWALIVDESVVIGQERFLLILGVDVNKWDFKQPLSSSDVEVLGLHIATSWKSEAIGKEIDSLKKTYQIAYVISDEGHNLQATWKHQNLVAISDCTHLWAKTLEKTYKEEADYKAFCLAVIDLRKRLILSKNSFLLPPPLRAKSRFHQIFQYVDWAIKIKQHYHQLDEQQQQNLSFVYKYEPLLREWEGLQKLVKKANKLLKVNGLSYAIIGQIKQYLAEDLPDVLRVGKFKKLVADYLENHQNKIVPEQNYLCCSDIIESIFGTYKQSIANGSQNITELVLALAALGKNFKPPEIKKSMEAVKVKDIQQWKEKNTTPSLAKNKRDFFTKNGGKKK
jgi:hypothetical protein